MHATEIQETWGASTKSVASNGGIAGRKVTPNGALSCAILQFRSLCHHLSENAGSQAYKTPIEGPFVKDMKMQLTFIGFSGRRLRAWIVGLLVFAACATDVLADMTGKQDFQDNCASCHGKDGKGNGEALYVIPGIKPPDLTKLAKNNGGVFPAEGVYKSIDGRAGIPAHSRIDMPFWGTTFQQTGKEFTPESEAKTKARISNIVNYIKSIQEK